MTLGSTDSNGNKKAEIIKAYQKSENDTGSTEVQVAILTDKIKYLTSHFGDHPKDKHSKRGMMAMISKRRKLLTYLKTESADRYLSLIDSLGLRK